MTGNRIAPVFGAQATFDRGENQTAGETKDHDERSETESLYRRERRNPPQQHPAKNRAGTAPDQTLYGFGRTNRGCNRSPSEQFAENILKYVAKLRHEHEIEKKQRILLGIIRNRQQ